MENIASSSSDIYDLRFLCGLLTVHFDGNRLLTHEYISQCDSMFGLASENQHLPLLAYAISRITGTAKSHLRDKQVETWGQLKDLLLQHFSDKKHYLTLMEELNTLKQKSHENVLTFYSKIDRCVTNIIDSMPVSDLGKAETIRELGLQRFIFHSSPEISRFLRCKQYKNLNEALNDGIEEERAVRMHEERLTDRRIPPKICNLCNQLGHFSRDCPRNQPKFTNPQQNPRRNSISCAYCRREGHHINQCRKREFNNNRKANARFAWGSPSYSSPNEEIPHSFANNDGPINQSRPYIGSTSQDHLNFNRQESNARDS